MKSLSEWVQRLLAKFGEVTTSAKFFVLLFAVVEAERMHATGSIDGWQTVIAIVAAVAAYSGSKALEDGLKARAR